MTKLQPFKTIAVTASATPLKTTAALSEDAVQAALSAVTNEELADLARQISQHDNLEVISVNSSGLNNPVTGTSGVSLHFRGRTQGGENKVLTFDDFYWLASRLKSSNSSIEGFEASIRADSSNFVLDLLADATRTS